MVDINLRNIVDGITSMPQQIEQAKKQCQPLPKSTLIFMFFLSFFVGAALGFGYTIATKTVWLISVATIAGAALAGYFGGYKIFLRLMLEKIDSEIDTEIANQYGLSDYTVQRVNYFSSHGLIRKTITYTLCCAWAFSLIISLAIAVLADEILTPSEDVTSPITIICMAYFIGSITLGIVIITFLSKLIGKRMDKLNPLNATHAEAIVIRATQLGGPAHAIISRVIVYVPYLDTYLTAYSKRRMSQEQLQKWQKVNILYDNQTFKKAKIVDIAQPN